jgi:hypothetical protein
VFFDYLERLNYLEKGNTLEKYMPGLEQSGDLTNERLELLAEIVGRDWLSENLLEYREFRQKYSLESRWWHRPPEISPIIPLVYFAKPGPRDILDKPFGVWEGNPSGILARLMASIVEFKDYWDQLPDNLGWNNLQYFLRSPQRFYAFRHEVRLATHLKYYGYNVEPYFFDPAANKGKADILVKDANQIYDIQCKARSPSDSSGLSYDLYLYFAGRWARMVMDSGRSYFLFLIIKQKMETFEVDQLAEVIQNQINSRVNPVKSKSRFWEIQLFELGYDKGQTPPQDIKNVTRSIRFDPLYSDIENLRPATSTTPPIVAGCHIFGHRGIELEDYVFSTAEKAARQHDNKNPLVISVNLYQEVDMSEYMRRPNVSRKYKTWNTKFFSDYRNVHMLLLSSNYDKYFEMGFDKFAVATKYFATESQYWDNVLKLFK